MQRLATALKMKKSVAVIGASASGLRVAKELIQTDEFDVTIFEKNSRVGGLWALDKDTRDALVDPFMSTNIGRHTQSFSDLAWESVHYQDSQKHSPMFPQAWQVGRYLETYKEKYIPQSCLRLGCKITEASLEAENAGTRWRLSWSNGSKPNESETGVYNYLVIASGFFSAPRSLPTSILPTLEIGRLLPPIIHSTQLRTLQDILPEDGKYDTGKILVVGGGISGADAAASLALMLSSAKHSPGKENLHGEIEIAHIFSRHFYAFPRFVPDAAPKRPSNGFVPWDLFSYELSRRSQDPIRAVTGEVAPERARITHESIRNMIGTDQSDISPALVSASLDSSPYVAINNLYAEFVRSGDIKPIYGRLEKLSARPRADNGAVIDEGSVPESLSAEILQQDNLTQFDDVVGVIYATGYTPHDALDFLSDDIKQKLEHDEASFRFPVILQAFQTYNPAVPNLGFVGFYEGPYWGIMEMQARLITKRWLGKNEQDMATDPGADEARNPELGQIRELRRSMKQRNPSTPQFWMADYLGLMEDMAAALDIKRDDSAFSTKNGPTVPARYVLPEQNLEQPQTTVSALVKDLDAAREHGRFVAAAAFRALQGAWTLRRKLDSALSTFPSGVLTGRASFHPRYPTDHQFDGEYLYEEAGVFKTRQGFEMHATRSYVYRYSETTDTISVWFVKADGKTVDYLFHNIDISDSRRSEIRGWSGEADHLCVEDMYNTSYKFNFTGVALASFDLHHKVNGPKKDYISDSHFSR